MVWNKLFKSIQVLTADIKWLKYQISNYQIFESEVYCCSLLQSDSKPICHIGELLVLAQNFNKRIKVGNMKKFYSSHKLTIDYL